MKLRPGLNILIPAEPGGRVRVDYRSASGAARLLIGREPEEAAALLGQVFAICPAAQQFAARLAMAAALNQRVEPETYAMGWRAVRLEALREHALRILLGWAAVLGEAPDRAAAAEINQRSRAGQVTGLRTIIADKVMGQDAADWLGWTSRDALTGWARAGESVAARMIARMLAHPGPAIAPPVAPETLLARHHGHPLFEWEGLTGPAAHQVARLIDLAMLADAFDGRGPGIAEPWSKHEEAGAGHAAMPCSRGLLTHHVRIADGRIVAYAILSPTDAAFGSGGYGLEWLERIAVRDPDKREAAARDILLALDPCVEHRVERA